MKLYFIKDLLSGVPFSSLIPAMNDVVAIKGFLDFLKNEKYTDEHYSLFVCGEIDDENHIVNNEYKCVCNGAKAEEIFKKLCAKLEKE